MPSCFRVQRCGQARSCLAESSGMPQDQPSSTRAERAAWCLYDFGNSAFPTVIVTALYVIYFKGAVVPAAYPEMSESELGGQGDWLWGLVNALGALGVFLIAPLLGAVADRTGRKRLFLVVFSLLCALGTLGLGLLGADDLALVMLALIVSVVGFEAALVFYNGFLPELVPAERIPRLSALGWGIGYIGGIGCLFAVLPLISGKSGDEALAAIGDVPFYVAAWFFLLTLPSLLLLRDHYEGERPPLAASFRTGWADLLAMLRAFRHESRFLRFLLAYFLYNNGILAVIVFAVAFTNGTLEFDAKESLYLVIMLNVVAAPGAYVYGLRAEKIGVQRALLETLVLWLVVCAGAWTCAQRDWFDVDTASMLFWPVAALASVVLGATQATSRTFVGQLAPEGKSAQYYGMMAFSGKGSAIFGPLLFGAVSAAAGQGWAVASLALLFGGGALVLRKVR
jgi:UMF1 family MFS transporter